jgi:DNA transformation protein
VSAVGTDTFRGFVLEQLAGLQGLRCRRMFGGYGLYCGERFFGIVHDGRLYFKTNSVNLPDYSSRNCPVFAPSEKQVLHNYREVPVEILEDAESLVSWAGKAADE